MTRCVRVISMEVEAIEALAYRSPRHLCQRDNSSMHNNSQASLLLTMEHNTMDRVLTKAVCAKRTKMMSTTSVLTFQ